MYIEYSTWVIAECSKTAEDHSELHADRCMKVAFLFPESCWFKCIEHPALCNSLTIPRGSATHVCDYLFYLLDVSACNSTYVTSRKTHDARFLCIVVSSY